MKTRIILFLFSSISPLYSLLAQHFAWVDISHNLPDTPYDTVYIGGDPYYSSFLDLFFINDEEGWVTSLQQNEEQQFLMFHTRDGGETWDIQTTLNYCKAIWMLDSLNGYAGGHTGSVFVTHNGGETWEYHGATGSAVTDISFAPGSETGYVSNDNSNYFHRITPGGIEPIEIGGIKYWSGISAMDEAVWLCGGTHVFHYDFAQQELIPELVNPCGYFGAIFFIDKDHGWIGNDCEIRGFVDYDYYWPVIFDTEEDAVTCIFAIDTNQFWATLWDGRILHTHNASDYGYIKETNDYWSNVSWGIQPHPYPGNPLNAIHFTSANKGYACGENNVLLKYTYISGIEDEKQEGVEVFPNPTTGQFKVHSSKCKVEFESLELLDLYGKVLAKPDCQMPTTNCELDISHLPSGIYFVRIFVDKEIIVKKISKL